MSVYRYMPEHQLREFHGPPRFELAAHFHYDRDELGSPTLPKLAKEAVRKMNISADPELCEWWTRPDAGGRRVWVWNCEGEFIGSIVVAVDFAPRLSPLQDTISRQVSYP